MRNAALALVLLAVSACATDGPLSPAAARPGSAPLASKQSTTSSTMLFWGDVPTIAGDAIDHVFGMNDDGTGVRQLTTTFSRYASWAPDGKNILFSKANPIDGFHISVMNADGTAITDLTVPPSGCSDARPHALGKQVVFVRGGGVCAEFGLFLMNADGTGLTLLDDKIAGGGDPAPSPKGGRLAYQRMDNDIWLLDLGTSGLTNLTKTAGGSDPSFSPSGKQIAFVRGVSIYIMNDNGTGVTQLTSPPAGFIDDVPRWSPDGKSIAFTRYLDGDVISGADILVMNADGTAVTNLTGQTLGTNHNAFISAWAR
jgi:Tol biopolymer transport system component